MSESFLSKFRKKAQPEPAKPKSHDEIHDDLTDQAFHHLHQLHILTHPNGKWTKLAKARGRSDRKISDLHADVQALMDKHGKRRNTTF